MRRVKAFFVLRGTTYTEWARSQGFSPQMTSYAILNPAPRGRLAARIRRELYRLLGDGVKDESQKGAA